MPKKGQTKVSVAVVKQKAEEYLKECERTKTVPLLARFEYILGVSENTLRAYRENPIAGAAIKRIEKAQEIALIDKGINDNKPVFSIFLLKSKHGYIEQQKLDVTTNGQPLGVVMLPNKQ